VIGRGDRSPRTLAALAAAALAALLAGCGVPLSDRAEPVAGYQPPPVAESTSTTTTDIAASGPRLWYVSGTLLAPQSSQVPGGGSPADLLAQLAVPPEDSQLATLVIDPLGGVPLVVTPPPVLSPTEPLLTDAVYVGVSDTFAQLASADQVLLIGQVVLTLTDPGLAAPSTSVVFVGSDGVELSVPLPDGRLIDRPVVRTDYLPLAVPAARTAQ
jgi:hypothetical protein